jgi:hypothetical protein
MRGTTYLAGYLAGHRGLGSSPTFRKRLGPSPRDALDKRADSRRVASPRHSWSRKLARSKRRAFDVELMLLARAGSSSAKRHTERASAASIHRSKASCFIARLLPKKRDI